MRKPLAPASAILVMGLLADPLTAQNPPQTAAQIMLDTTKLASGYRASKITGGGAIYEANETVGTVDELLIAVTYDSLKMAANKIMLPGANKEALKVLPEYRYTRSRRLLPAVKIPR